jgi:hypothetical protein
MKKASVNVGYALIISMLCFILNITSCKKDDNSIKFPKGTFPDTPDSIATPLTDINSEYDDYNGSLNQYLSDIVLVFSSTRGSSGGKTDLLQGSMGYTWDQTTGVFDYSSEITSDAFLTKLIDSANTSGDDFGPYRTFCAYDGFQYLLLASENGEGNPDLYYYKSLPGNGSTLPAVQGPYPATILNTDYRDEYICFDVTQNTAFFSSNRGGDFDIYLADTCKYGISTFLHGDYPYSVRSADSFNSSYDDECPFIHNKIMVFASNRLDTIGGKFDLYYSINKHGKWCSPINFGERINTTSNEFRPVLLANIDFTNYILIFSSDRPGGKGGYDLYFKGVTISTE